MNYKVHLLSHILCQKLRSNMENKHSNHAQSKSVSIHKAFICCHIKHAREQLPVFDARTRLILYKEENQQHVRYLCVKTIHSTALEFVEGWWASDNRRHAGVWSPEPICLSIVLNSLSADQGIIVSKRITLKQNPARSTIHKNNQMSMRPKILDFSLQQLH
jgi:hypothetical protein